MCSVFQRYNPKANHNTVRFLPFRLLVVLSISKIQSKSKSQLLHRLCSMQRCCAQYFKDTIQKQITTRHWLGPILTELCSVFQRYNPKANHNLQPILSTYPEVVLSISKIQSKSKSQRFLVKATGRKGCAQYFKDTIQKQITTYYSRGLWAVKLCSVFQRYNPKANHNHRGRIQRTRIVVLSISKIQSKSKSQRDTSVTDVIVSCAQYFKDTIQKQITT